MPLSPLTSLGFSVTTINPTDIPNSLVEKPHHSPVPVTGFHFRPFSVVSTTISRRNRVNSNTSSIDSRMNSRVRAQVCTICTIFGPKGSHGGIFDICKHVGPAFVMDGCINTQCSKRLITTSRRTWTETTFHEIPEISFDG